MNESGVTTRKIKILIIDNEPTNLNVLSDYLKGEEFEVITAIDKNIAVKKMTVIPDIDLIIIAQMLLHADGVELVKFLKKTGRYDYVPIICQTVIEQNSQIFEGIQAGICYYLVKPYDKTFLIRMIKAVLRDAVFIKEIVGEVKKYTGIPAIMSQSEFQFSTINEAKALAYFIANAFPDPDTVVYGLIELMLNAIEHGNLGITYDEKSILVESGQWQEEINRRLALPENKYKTATITFKSGLNSIVVSIKDQGDGFQWQQYLDLSASRMIHPNGRGVATAKLSFATMEYSDKGNEVVCTVFKK
jgi:DNA-binding response OmpR family regulator/anti-sigma regulatory factor (Ser/Thr protein kinase)